MLNAPLVENNMFNTLAFSKKMQNVGMTQEVAEELASTLFNLHLNQFENLLTKKEFSRFEGEIKKEIDGVKHEIDGVKHEIDGVKREIDGVKREIDGVKHEIDGVKHEIDGVKREMENFITKKEFYAETKNLSLNLTIKMGIIMTAGIGVLSLLLKL
jgi:uncharacterized coiled-coil DUF342 family protein